MALSASSVCYAGLLLVVSCAHILLQLHSALQHSHEGLRRTNDQLQASRARIVAAADAERRRIERDLHDGAQQRLVALAMELGRAKAKFADDLDAARELVDQAHVQAKEALTELRNLVRGVHPPVLTDRGLLDPHAPVTAYVPEVSDSGYAGATIQIGRAHV